MLLESKLKEPDKKNPIYLQKAQVFWQKLIKFIWDEDPSNI